MLRYIGIIIFLALLLIFSVNSGLKKEGEISTKIKKRNALREKRIEDEKLAEDLKKKDCIEYIIKNY